MFYSTNLFVLQWSTSAALPHEPLILEGGFAMWHLTYAVTCVGVYKRRPSSDVSTKTTKKESLSSYASPSSLDYPEFPTLRSVQFRCLINSYNIFGACADSNLSACVKFLNDVIKYKQVKQVQISIWHLFITLPFDFW